MIFEKMLYYRNNGFTPVSGIDKVKSMTLVHCYAMYIVSQLIVRYGSIIIIATVFN